MNAVESCLNPFDDNVNKNEVYHLTTGKAAAPEIRDFLINVKIGGEQQMIKFITECESDPNRFSRSINKNRIYTFSSNMYTSSESNKQSNVNSMVNEIRAERDIIGQILAAVVCSNIDLDDVLSFPLTSVPCSLGKYDGTIYQYKMQNTMNTIYSTGTNSEDMISDTVNIEIIDGIEFVNSMIDIPSTYGELCDKVLEQLCDTSAVEIYVLFPNTPKNATIKNYYSRNGVFNQPIFTINGPSQKRPDRFVKCFINSCTYRQDFVKFILNHWKNSDIDPILEKKRLFVSFGEKTYLFSSEFQKGLEIASLGNNHSGMETKIILFLSKMSEKTVLIKVGNPEPIYYIICYTWTSTKQFG